MNIEKIILDLCSYSDEQEWFEFKENWFNPEELGEYVSALSNAAAFHYKKYGFFIWGINDKTHDIVGTSFNPYCDFNKEPYQNYLARNLYPSINFEFKEVEINQLKVVVLVIPAAEEIPTSFKDKRYIRIGSSKSNIRKYPKRKIQLFKILNGHIETITTQKAEYQNLTFNKLFGYYGSRGIVLKEETFEKNLNLRNSDGDYNTLAQLLSDNSHKPLRVSIFDGDTKASNLISVREFGNTCLLYSLDNLLQYGDVLNLIQSDETNRVVERTEVALFDSNAFREAVVNAVLHNNWVSGNEPMISVFHNRIEILSRGSIAPAQTIEGFFQGQSVPVNEKLSEIFLQLHISEKSGRGVPIITNAYGEEAISFRENAIVVTIPFNRITNNENKVDIVKKVKTPAESSISLNRFPELNPRRQTILLEIQQNPYISKLELAEQFGISQTAIDKNIAFLRENGYIERIGKTKGGYWKVIKK